MSILIRFQDFLGKKGQLGQPPATIKAKDLDHNFEALKVKNLKDATGVVIGTATMTQDGQNLQLVGFTVQSLDVCINGQTKTIKILAKSA